MPSCVARSAPYRLVACCVTLFPPARQDDKAAFWESKWSSHKIRKYIVLEDLSFQAWPMRVQHVLTSPHIGTPT